MKMKKSLAIGTYVVAGLLLVGICYISLDGGIYKGSVESDTSVEDVLIDEELDDNFEAEMINEFGAMPNGNEQQSIEAQRNESTVPRGNSGESTEASTAQQTEVVEKAEPTEVKQEISTSNESESTQTAPPDAPQGMQEMPSGNPPEGMTPPSGGGQGDQPPSPSN